jgi:hypothetical protein
MSLKGNRSCKTPKRCYTTIYPNNTFWTHFLSFSCFFTFTTPTFIHTHGESGVEYVLKTQGIPFRVRSHTYAGRRARYVTHMHAHYKYNLSSKASEERVKSLRWWGPTRHNNNKEENNDGTFIFTHHYTYVAHHIGWAHHIHKVESSLTPISTHQNILLVGVH